MYILVTVSYDIIGQVCINLLFMNVRMYDYCQIPCTHHLAINRHFIIFQNPQFQNVLTHVVFAHLLRQIAGLPDHDHHFLVHWFKK